MKSSIVLSAAALIVSSAQAHITMQSPLPYNELFDTAPLNPSGSDFPCKKGDTGYSAKSVANATVGQPIQVSFKGSADHNGGSCQFVLSKDGFSSLAPTSKFKVIYSVMGGCPGISGTENTYSVPIPSEIPSGSYTMGWTWFNKIGNREVRSWISTSHTWLTLVDVYELCHHGYFWWYRHGCRLFLASGYGCLQHQLCQRLQDL